MHPLRVVQQVRMSMPLDLTHIYNYYSIVSNIVITCIFNNIAKMNMYIHAIHTDLVMCTLTHI